MAPRRLEVLELRRIYWTTQRRLGWRSFSEIQGRDVVELKRMLHALGYWRKDLAAFPQEPVVRADPALQRTDPERYQKLIDERRQAFESFMKELALYDAAAMDAVDAFRKDHGLVFEGNPRGLVDERFVQALREAYQKKK